MPKITFKDGSKARAKALKELYGPEASHPAEITEGKKYIWEKSITENKSENKLEGCEERAQHDEDLADKFMREKFKPPRGDRTSERTLEKLQCIIHSKTWEETVKEMIGAEVEFGCYF